MAADVTDAPKTVAALVEQPVPAGLPPHGYVMAVLIGVDILVNALLGGRPYSTISARIGLSIRNNGWASRVPWPAWWRAHCAASIYTTVV